MEDLRLLRHFLVLLGTIALICSMIGYFSQGWLEYDLRIILDEEVVDVKVSRGLWATSGCVVLNFTEFTHEACGTITENKMDQFIDSSDLEDEAKVATSDLFENFTKLRILLMFGGIHGVVGLIFSLFIHKGCRNIFVKSRGYCCVYSWGASAVLVMTAVILQASQASSYNGVIDSLEVTSDVRERIRLKATVSWVMYISGTGSLIGVIMALVLLVKLCCIGKLQNPAIRRSETEQTIADDISSSEDEDGMMDEGEINLGFGQGIDTPTCNGKQRETDKNVENPDLNIKCLMDIYM